MLTDDERARLGGDFRASYEDLGTLDMWSKSRDMSGSDSLIEAGRVLGLLDEATAAWLSRETGKAPVTRDRPSWNSTKGELRFEGRLVRNVRVMAESNIQEILDKFESSRWPRCIDNPLTGGPQQLHDALRCLNSGLKEICFHSQAGAHVITWDQI